MALLVFAQREHGTLEIEAMHLNAVRFFKSRVGLADDGRVRVGSGGSARRCTARPRTDEDLAAAERADAKGSGLALLARRCGYVWTVEEEGEDDRDALLVAAILSSVVLGPIMKGEEIFGVKTARERLGV